MTPSGPRSASGTQPDRGVARASGGGRQFLDPEVIARLAHLDVRARLVVEGFIAGMHRSPFHGFSVEFAEHRQYSPGDDLRYLDWRVFGKQDRFYIKQYEEETNLYAYILHDKSRSMGYGSSTPTKFEYANYIAASLAHLLLRQRDSVSLVLFSEGVERFLPGSTNPAHIRPITRALEETTPGGTTNFGATLHDIAERMPRRGLVILISDFFGDLQDILLGLKHLRHKRHEVIVFQVLDEYEVTFPFKELTLFRGMELPQQLFAEPRSLREQYLAELGQFVSSLRSECLNNQSDFVTLKTTDPLDVALASFVATRMATRKWKAGN